MSRMIAASEMSRFNTRHAAGRSISDTSSLKTHVSGIREESISNGGEVAVRESLVCEKGETINLAKDLCQQIRAHVRLEVEIAK